eukprot:XP_014625975.1 uncharacterized protein LOC106796860 [Glycine max]
MDYAKQMKTPMHPTTVLGMDEESKQVDEKTYKGMIRSLLYLTASKPDIMFSNVGYVIKANLMLCGIHHFFKDPKVVVLELICEFWRIAKVYRNKVIGGYFTGKVLGISVKLSVETIAKAISCEGRGTKFMNWGDELEDHIRHSLWGPN